MKYYFLTFLTILFSFSSSAQSSNLSNSEISRLLYDNYYSKSFDTEGRLINERNGNNEFRTAIGEKFYYKIGNTRKAIVVLFSYDYSSGEKKDCHGCYPDFDLATFSYSNEKWKKTRFIKSWEGASGTNGEPASISVKYFKNTLCLVVSFEYFHRGEFETFTNYYNIETLEEVK